MPSHPSQIWKRLTPELQRRITDELSAILQEVLYEQIRIGDCAAPAAQGDHLHSTVDAAPGALQSREPALAVRLATARPGAGLAGRGHWEHLSLLMPAHALSLASLMLPA